MFSICTRGYPSAETIPHVDKVIIIITITITIIIIVVVAVVVVIVVHYHIIIITLKQIATVCTKTNNKCLLNDFQNSRHIQSHEQRFVKHFLIEIPNLF